MRRLETALVVFLATLLALAVGQVDKNPLVIPGTELGWEAAELDLVLRVSEKTQVKLEVYSPGFDPNDYRAPNELGDERYDGGKSPLKTVIRIFDEAGNVRLQREFGVESHRWYKLIDGELAAGDYLIKMQFFGNAKNALAFKLTADKTKATLQVAPDSMQTYNVHGGKWAYPFSVTKRDWSAPITVGIYDGDGPQELLVRVIEPDGAAHSLPSPGNQEWVRYRLEKAGTYSFGFRQPEGARQYTNTVGFKVFLGDVKVRVVDESGREVRGAEYRVSGYYDRTAYLSSIPDGWQLVKLESKDGLPLSDRRVLFGPGGGEVTYVLRPEKGRLLIQAAVTCASESYPVPLRVKVGDRQVMLNEAGTASIELPSGEYPLSIEAPGAQVDAPASVKVVAGSVSKVQIGLRPGVQVDVAVHPTVIAEGRSAQVVARATTRFPYPFPAEMRLELPNGLISNGNPAVAAPLSANHPLGLKAEVYAERKGDYRLTASVSPCQASATSPLVATRPAAFSVSKKALTPRVKVGEEARFAIEVRNEGEQPGRVRVVDELPPGLEGKNYDATFLLQPGETQRISLGARVTGGAGKRTNTVHLYDEAGRLIGQASADVLVEEAKVALTRSLDTRTVVPGEQVKVCLQVANVGDLPVAYKLQDEYPEWLEPLKQPAFEGRLEPEEGAEHCYEARVRFGSEAQGRFLAHLSSDAGRLEVPDTIRRMPLGLEKTVSPQRVLVGGQAEFTVTLTNPTDHPVAVRLLETPARGLGMVPAEEVVTLAAGETRSFHYPAIPEQTGYLVNKVAVFVGNTPAASPAKAGLKVLPRLQPRRLSEIDLPFSVEGSGDTLLIAHKLPEGAVYRLGSSRLDGRPVTDPRLTEDGRLVWKIPYQGGGVIAYTVEHSSALPMLGEPDLTLLAGDRELNLVGRISLEDYRKARPVKAPENRGMIRLPADGSVFHNATTTKIRVVAPNGENVEVRVNGQPVPRDLLGEAKYNGATGLQTLTYYNVPLAEGRNLITVRAGVESDQVEVFRAGRPVQLAVVPVEAIADGSTPIRLRIEARDKAGLTSGMGFVTVESSQEPMLADANLQISGYQVFLKDGVGELVLRPLVSPGEVVVKLAKDGLETTSKVYVPGPDKASWTAQGSVTVRYDGAVEVGGQAKAYAEVPLAGGTLQGALGVTGTVAGGAVQHRSDLLNRENPTRRFPLTGSGTEVDLPLESDDGVAFKYDSKRFSVGYYKTALKLPGLSGLPTASALVVNTRGDLEAGAFAALLPSAEVLDEIIPDGTRIYRLSHAVMPGSEKVVVRRGAVETELAPLRDYVIDYPSGRITLAWPLWPTDENLVPVTLVVQYAPATATRDVLAYGAGVRYRFGQFSFGVAAATLDRGATWRFGAEVAYIAPTLKLTLTYSRLDGQDTVGLSAAGRQGAFEAAGNLRYDGALQGKLRVAAKVGTNGKVALEHRATSSSNRSALLYEHRFGSITTGLGLGYEWTTATPSAIGRLGYKAGNLGLTLTHRQSFSVAPSLSTLGFSYAFDANLKGEGELAYEWGTGFSGSLGLKQRLGPANLSISYQLPNASGDGNRARFGIRAPLPLTDRWSLDLSAGYERSLASRDWQAAAGAGLRYKSNDLSATLGVEGAVGSSGNKVTVRSGATGKLDERQTVSFDANYVIEGNPYGRFTLAYAYRGRTLQVLTYHRMINENGTSFEGELAPTWHPSLSFQLRPSAAYRVSLDDPAASLYQIGVVANYYFTSSLGMGGGVYYLWQPALSTSSTAFSIEGSLRVIDPVWLNLGYTFGGFNGLTPEARPGVYLRLDLSAPSPACVHQCEVGK